LTANEESLLIRYLLGDVAEDEQASIEERFFQDDSYFEELSALEDELINDYVGGRMAVEDQLRFDRRMASSPELRRRVDFTRGLVDAVGVAGRDARPRPTASSNLASFLTLSGPGHSAARKLAIAMTLGFVIVAGWSFLQRRALKFEIGELQRDRARLEHQGQTLTMNVTEDRVRISQLADELLSAERKGADLDQQLRSLARQSEPFASFFLMPGLSRGGDGDDRPPRLIVPSAHAMRLRLVLPAGEPSRRYRATLKTVDGDQLWGEESLSAQPTGSGTIVTLRLPSSAVPEGRYVLTVEEDQAPGSVVGSYYFSVLRR